MPGEKLEKSAPIQLLKIIKMETENNSHQELVRAGVDTDTETTCGKTLRNVTVKEWIVVAILCFINLINYMDRFTLAGILDQIQTHFHIGDDKTGLLQTVFVLSYMVFAPIFGYLGDRYSRKAIMAGGVFLWSLTTLLGSYMNNFYLFLMFRALVGIGEASYSTIAPTIISDLFVGDVRSKMLAFFYFAIPVGSGLGYIVGSETAKAAGSWQWGLRVTPGLGMIAVLLIVFILRDPERGQSEGSEHLQPTSWSEDLKDLAHNKSFIFSSAGFTCVAFVAGALAWWGPKFIDMGFQLQSETGASTLNSLSLAFGVITMMAGIAGVALGSILSNNLKLCWPTADPLICGCGLVLSAPLLLGATYAATANSTVCYVLLFLGQLTLNLNWAIVCDIVLYVVIPTRRSTAQGLQLLVSHALGDAGSPFLIGVISEALKVTLNETNAAPSDEVNFRSLQYALFTTCFVEIIGGFFFLVTAFYIIADKTHVEKVIHAHHLQIQQNDSANENENSTLVS